MEYILINSQGELRLAADRELPYVDPIKFTRNVDSTPRYQRSGEVERGVGRVPARTIALKAHIIGNSPTQYEYMMNRIAAFFSPQYSPHYLQCFNTQKRALVSLAGINPGRGGDYTQGIDTEISLKMVESMWESREIITDWNTYSNGEKIVVDIEPLAFDTIGPVIEIIPADDLPDFGLTVGETSAAIRITDATFGAGKTMTIDCENGSLTVTDAEGPTVKPQAITGGTYVFLTGGRNNILYEGSADIQARVKYRMRTVF